MIKRSKKFLIGFYKLNKSRIEEYGTIIVKFRVIIIPTLLYIILKYQKFEFLPDFLGMEDINSTNYFELLINATASIFGIVIAVILLTFEFVKHTSFRRKDKNIFTNRDVIKLISLAISIIVLSLFGYITIKDFKQPNDLTIAYYLGFIFIIFIISIFPATKKILETANTLKITIEEIKNLTLTQYQEISRLRDIKFISKNNNLALVRIRQSLLTSIIECDYEAYTTILEELNNKSIELIGLGESRDTLETIFDGMTFIWRAGNSEALRLNNYQFYHTIWECIEELYEYAAKNKIPLLHYQNLYSFQREFIQFLSRNRLGNVLEAGTKTISSAFKQNLKFNCPIQEEIKTLYFKYEKATQIKNNSDSELQWLSINELLFLIFSIQSSALKNTDKELFDTCKFELEFIVSDIVYDNKIELKIYQEAFIITTIISNQIAEAYLVDSEKIFKESLWNYTVSTTLVCRIINGEKFYIETILQDIGDFIIKCAREKILDKYAGLNYLGAIARNLSDIYSSNKTAKHTIEYICDVLIKIKLELEMTDLSLQIKIYNETKEQIESIKTWLIKDNNDGKDLPLVKRIEQTLKEFKEITGTTDFRIIKWGDK